MHRDPVCGRRMNPNKAYAKVKHDGAVYLLCCPLCQQTFERHPERYVTESGLEAGGERASGPGRRHQGRRFHRAPGG